MKTLVFSARRHDREFLDAAKAELFFRDLSIAVAPDDVPQRLVSFPNVIVTGHQAFFTREAIGTICRTTLESIAEFEAGKPLSHEVGERG